MTRSKSVAMLGPEYEDFLFAPIGEERNGTLLSVLSALARLDVDPWQEAAKLALLPTASATQRLASLLTKLPDRPSSDQGPETIAARLIALLPSQAAAKIAPRETLLSLGAVANSMSFRYVIFVIFILIAQYALGSLQPPMPDDTGHAQVSSVAPPKTPPSNAGK